MAAGLFFKEVPIETRYFPEASSISFGRSVTYGLGVMSVLLRYFLHSQGILKDPRLAPRATVHSPQ